MPRYLTPYHVTRSKMFVYERLGDRAKPSTPTDWREQSKLLDFLRGRVDDLEPDTLVQAADLIGQLTKEIRFMPERQTHCITSLREIGMNRQLSDIHHLLI